MGLFNRSKEDNDKDSGYDRPPLSAPNDPPPYNEFGDVSQPPAPPAAGVSDYNSLSQSQTPQGYPDEKKQGYGNEQQLNQYQQYPPQQYQDYPPQQFQQYPNQPNQAPVYVVPRYEPTVNIANARPDQVNPAYQDYLRRDEQRIAQGDLPNDYKKPLAEKKTDKSKKTGGGAFPGRQGASYYNAANK